MDCNCFICILQSLYVNKYISVVKRVRKHTFLIVLFADKNKVLTFVLCFS